MPHVQHPAFAEDILEVDDTAPWIEQGWKPVTEKEAVVADLQQAPPVAPEMPARNASFEVWAEYARSQGATPEQLTDATRDQLRDQYNPPPAD